MNVLRCFVLEYESLHHSEYFRAYIVAKHEEAAIQFCMDEFGITSNHIRLVREITSPCIIKQEVVREC